MNSLLAVERHTNNNNHNSSTKYYCLRIASPSIALNKRFRLGRPWTYMLPKDQCMRYVNLYILIMLRCEEKWNISFFFHHSFHHSLLVWCVCVVCRALSLIHCFIAHVLISIIVITYRFSTRKHMEKKILAGHHSAERIKSNNKQ